jgi:hypothetical protein
MFENTKHCVLLAALVVNLTLAQCSTPKNNISADPQSDSKIIPKAKQIPPASIPQGKAAGELIPFRRTDEDLKDAIMAHPFPNVWLTFTTSSKQGQPQSDSPDRGETTAKVELPDEANQLLRTYWQTYLKATYNMDIKDMPEGESYLAQMVVISRSSDNTTQKLMKVDIEAPNGKRKLSWDEARDLTSLISGFAKDIINQAKAR